MVDGKSYKMKATILLSGLVLLLAVLAAIYGMPGSRMFYEYSGKKPGYEELARGDLYNTRSECKAMVEHLEAFDREAGGPTRIFCKPERKPVADWWHDFWHTVEH